MTSLKLPSTRTIPPHTIRWIPVDRISTNDFIKTTYGDDTATDDLWADIEQRGVLVPLVVMPDEEPGGYVVVSGQRRLAAARQLRLETVPCEVRRIADRRSMEALVLAYNRQRRKTFSQMMREADVLEQHEADQARERRLGNLVGSANAERRNSDARGRTDVLVAQAIGLGQKDLYRQARAVWRASKEGDPRAMAAVGQIDAGTKSIHAAYKDLRRRDRFGVDFRPTPYDVWSFRKDSAFGLPYPGAIPATLVAHVIYYFTKPGDLVVDPMAGGGVTVDVCASMGRRCLAYDIHSIRPDVRKHDVNRGFPAECSPCDLIFCDPPYHTMHAHRYGEPSPDGIAELPFSEWLTFLERFGRLALETLKPGGILALLLANQTEKDLIPGYEYFDHAFFGYEALRRAGLLPVRRISCPMAGTHLPQQVRRARAEGRLLGQVRDLLVMRKSVS